MKNMNEEKQGGVLQRFANGVADKLEEVGVGSRVCWNTFIYEPELPAEVIEEIKQAK